MDSDSIRQIASHIENDLEQSMKRGGMMFRLFSRVKTERSIIHKKEMEDDLYLNGTKKIQDIIGLRIVVYFPDDVDVLSFFLERGGIVKRAVDELDSSTFRPQRLNLTHSIPEEYVGQFRKALPEHLAQYIDNTYEIQIRTIFSEGWHEVEHDLRYKCKEDWVGYDSYSRTLNGVIATLETTEWSMKSLFHEMAYQNLQRGNYRAMLRNKMRIRMKDDRFSPEVEAFLSANPEVARGFIDSNRIVFVLSLLNHKGELNLTFDNVLFLVNRMEMRDERLMALEKEQNRNELDAFLAS